ncbi:MAG: M6 family metalloprotease domain-containing protein [Planctomycetes bacterium]|nr:M6 family metalloprotease domain-containing protein [Planctomycetota bacterium]
MLALAPVLAAQDAKGPDLSEFKTVETAITTKISKGAATQASSPGYLGVAVNLDAGNLVVSDVEENSPAAKAGVLAGDVLVKVDGKAVKSAEMFRSLLQTKAAGESIKLTVQRQKDTKDLSAKMIATSRVIQAGQKRAIMGVTVDEDETAGAKLKVVTAGMPADKAGLKVGDVVLKMDGRTLNEATRLTNVLADHKPGDTLTLLVKPQGKEKEKEVKVVLVEEGGFIGKAKGGKGGGGLSWDNRTGAWKKDTYRLAIVGIEYPDVKHNEKIAAESWDDALFSSKSYTKTSITGQKVFGSLNDYYQEQSFGKLKVTGKAFKFVTVSKKRSEYAAANTGPAKTALLGEALDALYKRDGKDALKDFDGIFFCYAGDRVQTNRGGLYWPHKAFFTHQGQRWPYFIVQEGGARMCDISVICHEFGHMLGLPDLYARPENPGSEGVGVWCAMSNQVGGGKPQHFCAWSKEQLGWITPAVIDPSVKQKLILSPVENGHKECFKVLARTDGSEYFLLENRKRKGFDASLPAEGLLIWRVVQGRPILEESHGIEGPNGPRVFLDSVPFPSNANRSFTPFTTPSSRPQLGGGLPVHITNIRRLPDGRITFYVGYEYY